MQRILLEKYDRYSVEATDRRRAAAKERVAKWRRDNPEKYREQYTRYQQKHREKINARNYELRREKPELYKMHSRKGNLKNNFGITLEQWDELLNKQGGLCAICRKPEGSTKYRFHVDHCHFSGRIRGLLCTRCNTGIGQLGDDPRVLEQAIAYLRGGV